VKGNPGGGRIARTSVALPGVGGGIEPLDVDDHARAVVEAIVALLVDDRRGASERIADQTMERVDERVEGLPGKQQIGARPEHGQNLISAQSVAWRQCQA
jgi:hypothetical protein